MEVLHGFYDSKQFLPGHTVVSFWSGQTLAKVGDDTLLTLYFLGQYSSDALTTSIYIQNKLFPSFRIFQDWSRWRFRDRNYQVIQNELLCFGCDFGRTIKLRTPQSRFLHGRLRLHGLDQVCCEGFTHRLKEMVLRYPILEV
ncbi:hypothetical protein TNCT_273991 [Trichonephila clavata]|uniref:Uncharacterized protein n=1 Tax=Trichonephila clavata TaxID=2740835 RepID=A0A8X6LCN6_TRICU|nr:hypothetical protein TNCT_273991 [Trichonephila clavata]